MQYYRLPQSELTVSSFCLSASAFGTGMPDAVADTLLGMFREAGGNFIDTAHCYRAWLPDGNGASERGLGACLRRSGNREGIIIGTKGGHPTIEPYYLRPDDYLAPEVIAQDIDESLERLGVEVIDFYWLHRDDARRSVADVIETLNNEITCGRIRAIGASNWSIARIMEANAYAAAHELHGFAASQPEYNLAHSNGKIGLDPTMRYLMAEDVAWHRGSGLPVVAYSPTAHGYFATDGQASAGAYDNPVSRARLQRVQQLAVELGCTPNQVALAYLRNQPFAVIPILGTINPEHLADGLGANVVQLTDLQLCWLESGAE